MEGRGANAKRNMSEVWDGLRSTRLNLSLLFIRAAITSRLHAKHLEQATRGHQAIFAEWSFSNNTTNKKKKEAK